LNPEQWRRVRDLFERGLDRAAVDVQEWLAREAGDDPAVRAEAASLLDHHSRAGAFLSEPVAGRVAHLLEEQEGAFEPGALVGPYTIVREIGRGGMGRVYLATDARLGRTVALKALPPALTRDPLRRERLRREARAAASLSHPNICTIYALEELNDDVFIVAEFIDGRTLREEIEGERRPSPPDLLASARALAGALACAHDRGIIHRDLKPENVMRSRDGRLKVLDFGLARVDAAADAFHAAPSVSLPGAIVGTPAYMSPEQLRGERGDARSDIFSFGMLLYEYACGVHPFEAETPLALAARILEGEPRTITSVRADVPVAVASVIDRCLRKAPADRWPSGAAVADVLARDDVRPTSTGVAVWWRTHQAAAVALYFTAVAVAWRIKEWQHGMTDAGFLLVGVAAAVAGVFRGHLLFTERMNRGAFHPERRRAEPVTLVIDGLIGLVLAAEGWLLAVSRPVAGVLTIALGIGIFLTRFVIERATERSAFEVESREA
jgi:predicted Ser/Thr protein kinase